MKTFNFDDSIKCVPYGTPMPEGFVPLHSVAGSRDDYLKVYQEARRGRIRSLRYKSGKLGRGCILVHLDDAQKFIAQQKELADAQKLIAQQKELADAIEEIKVSASGDKQSPTFLRYQQSRQQFWDGLFARYASSPSGSPSIAPADGVDSDSSKLFEFVDYIINKLESSQAAHPNVVELTRCVGELRREVNDLKSALADCKASVELVGERLLHVS